MENRILLIGDGGHCKSIIDTLLKLNSYDEIGIVSKEKINKKILGINIVGNDDELEDLLNDGWNNAFVAIGSVGDVTIRKILLNKLKEIGYNIPNIIDNSSIISRFATLGEGIYIGRNVIINSDSLVDSYSIINDGSIIEHDCKIGKYVHISPNATICGSVVIGDNTHIGASSIIKQCITIGNNSLIGIGSVVTKDIGDNVIAYGNPCKVIRKK